jgi:hypothetical protein
MTDTARSINGTEIQITNLQIGDKVLAIDYKDRIVPTEVISFLHYENNSQSKIKTFLSLS